MLDEIEELTQRLSEEQENKRKMGDKLSHERHQFQRDKEATQEVSWVICLLPMFPYCLMSPTVWWRSGNSILPFWTVPLELKPLGSSFLEHRLTSSQERVVRPTSGSLPCGCLTADRGPPQAARTSAAPETGGGAAARPQQQPGPAGVQQPRTGE